MSVRATIGTKARGWGRRLSAPVREYFRRRRTYHLTLEGLLFIGVTLSIGLAAFNTGTNLLYLICSMLLSFLILSGLVSTNSLRGLDVTRSAPRHTVAGEPCRVEIAVRNRKRWSHSYSLRVVDNLSNNEGLGAVYFLTVPRRSTAHASYRTVFRTRGRYCFGRLAVSSRFPFGLMERTWSRPIERDILVYPRLVDVAPMLREAEVDLGEIESGKRGPGTSLYQLREYTGGESARQIHWKTSAKARRLMVRETEKEEKRRVSLYLNNAVGAAPEAELRDRFERAVVLAGSLARHLLENDYQVQLVTGSGKVPFGTGISHLHRCLRALARVELFTPERHLFGLPPPEAECTNLYLRYDPSRADEVYGASATILSIDRWFERLNPFVIHSALNSSLLGGGRPAPAGVLKKVRSPEHHAV